MFVCVYVCVCVCIYIYIYIYIYMYVCMYVCIYIDIGRSKGVFQVLVSEIFAMKTTMGMILFVVTSRL